MDKTTKLDLIRRIAEWEETENPDAALPIASDLIRSFKAAIEDDAEMEGWYSELELAEQGVIFVDGGIRCHEIQEALLPGNPEAHIVCLNDMLYPDDKQYFAVFNDGAGHVRTLESDSLESAARFSRFGYDEASVAANGHIGDYEIGKWRVHLVMPGDRYGVDDSVEYRDAEAQEHGESLPLVEFYDVSQDPARFPGGQFVSRYYMSTLFDERWNVPINAMADEGLSFSLDAGIPSWTIEGSDLNAIGSFLASAKSRIEHSQMADSDPGSDLVSEEIGCREAVNAINDSNDHSRRDLDPR